MRKIAFLFCLFIAFSATAQKGGFKNLTEKNGKIGIGTNSPDELLTVKGIIHAQEVKVDLNGAVAPDYVFEKYFTGYSQSLPDYEIISLEALEAFLQENNHLPNSPSAKEMEENGIDLKKMNLLLLQKIEELTIYTLQQQKEIEKLKEKVFE